MARLGLSRLARLLHCSPGADGSPPQEDASPPPEYRSVDVRSDSSKKRFPSLLSRTMKSTVSRSASKRASNTTANTATTLPAEDEEERPSWLGPTAKFPDYGIALPNGDDANLRTNSDLVQATFVAAQKGDEELDQWLEKGYGIEVRDKKEWTALRWALHLGQDKAVQRLVEKGADINMATVTGETELHRAVTDGDSVLVAALLRHGADANATDKSKKTALHYAIDAWIKSKSSDQADHLSMVKLLAEKGTNLELRNRYGNTAFHDACLYGDEFYVQTPRRLEMLKTMVQAGVPVNTRDAWGATPLIRCCTMSKPDQEIIDFLLDHGADINAVDQNGASPIDKTCFQAHSTQLLRHLIARGAKPDFNKRTILATPLQYAAEFCDEDRVQFLLRHGAAVDTRTYAQGCTALHLAVKSTAEHDIRDKMELLIRRGADINARDLVGRTPLHYAARNLGHWQQDEIVECLIGAGAQADVVDGEGKTPLSAFEGYFVRKGGIVKRLVDAGAKPVEGMELYEYIDKRREGEGDGE
ncbi:hypothetical protein FQN53_006889 [Emmonsiellopsis sp. PD_33]|nr:hypothetical protein FQN53_006889 [Emmonsiellopsis sp. PD_33]